MLQLAPPLQQALADRAFAHSGEAKWDPERALDIAARQGGEAQVPAAHRTAVASLACAPAPWFGRRLTMLWTMFMLGRPTDQGAQTLWMAEAARLLGDLPHDILAHSIDEAIKVSRHGFMPSVGEIRGIADPLVGERRKHIERLGRMAEALDDVAASEQRLARREDTRRHAEHIQR
jgi:hypothetical protein